MLTIGKSGFFPENYHRLSWISGFVSFDSPQMSNILTPVSPLVGMQPSQGPGFVPCKIHASALVLKGGPSNLCQTKGISKKTTREGPVRNYISFCSSKIRVLIFIFDSRFSVTSSGLKPHPRLKARF